MVNLLLNSGASLLNGKPITYLTQWKIVGNSEMHTDPFLTPWKVSGNSVVQDGAIMSCGDLGQDGKYHVKISNGVTIFDIPLDAPLRKVNDIADTIEFPSDTEGKALVTRNLALFSTTKFIANRMDGQGKACITKSLWRGGVNYTSSQSGNILCNKIDTVMSLDSSRNYNRECIATYVDLIIVRNGAIEQTVEAYQSYFDSLGAIESVYQLATPITELIDVSPFAVSPTDTYTSANVVPYSAFEHIENKEIWSCGEYNPTDGKYHILVQPLGGSIADIALDAPLRKVNNVADTIEFPSSEEGTALVTRNVGSKIVSAYTNKDGSQLTTTLPDNTILHIKQFVKNGDFSDGSTEWRNATSQTSCDYSQNKAVISNNVVGHGYTFAITQDIRSNIVIGNSYYFKYNAIPCKDIVLGADFSNRSNTGVSCVGNTDNIVSNVVIPASLNQFYLGFPPTTDYEVGDTTEVDNAVSFDLDVMFADCPNLKPTTASDFEALFTNLSYIDYSSDTQEVIVNDGKLYKEDVIGVEILVPLTTPTTELVDAPQIEEADSYSMVISQGGKAVSWSSFETN